VGTKIIPFYHFLPQKVKKSCFVEKWRFAIAGKTLLKSPLSNWKLVDNEWWLLVWEKVGCFASKIAILGFLESLGANS
jgi:hypothetical protein